MIFTLNLMLQNAEGVLNSFSLNLPASAVLSGQWFNQWGKSARIRNIDGLISTEWGTIVCLQKYVENLQKPCSILEKSIHLKALFEMFLAIEFLFFLPTPEVSLKPNPF